MLAPSQTFQGGHAMTDQPAGTYPPSAAMAAGAHADKATYDAMYAASINDPEGFWAEHGKRLEWIKPFTKVKNTSFAPGAVDIKWFEDGTLNVSANCIDRHLATRGDQTAIIWEPDSPDEEAQHITYKVLHEKTSRMANALKELGVGKGDRVVLYMPMIPEAAYAMLACARIGAIHSIVFAGFSADALAARLSGCQAKVVITADGAPRGGRVTNLKDSVNQALINVMHDCKCLCVRRTGQQIAWRPEGDYWLHEMEAKVSADCPPEEMNAEDPLFILYTSGSTGMPKGVVHSTGGYLVYAAMTHQYTFDYHDGDIFWCTADVGWVTGHSYIVYGPLANGGTTVMFEGVPTYPDAGRFWAVCEKHKVNQFYTAPTAIRALMAHGNEPVEKYDLSDIKVLGTVGEPINPEAWNWYNDIVGKGKAPIVDTWWQTETGGHLLTPLPGAIATKPGSATVPFFGILPVILEPTTGDEMNDMAAEGVLWESHGEAEFSIEEKPREARGTSITLHLKKDCEEFADDFRVRSVITKYSDHISVPVMMIKPPAPPAEGEEEPENPEIEFEAVNAATALWTRGRSEVSDEEWNISAKVCREKAWPIIEKELLGTDLMNRVKKHATVIPQ